jgi:serine/threonine protein phosphatase PrpC
MNAVLQARVTAFTHQGAVRDHNEDTVAVGSWIRNAPMEMPRQTVEPLDDPLLCVVADGMGGHAAGEEAGRIAAFRLAAASSQVKDEGEMTALLRRINQEIFDAMGANPGRLGMGTTVAGLLFRSNGAIWFNVGDTRIYRYRDGFLRQLSIDDVLDREGHRGGGSHAITQALGGEHKIVEVTPHVGWEPIVAGWCYLLCSDGLTDHVDLNAIEAVVALGGEAAVKALFERAMAGGGQDNISIILVCIEGNSPVIKEGRRGERVAMAETHEEQLVQILNLCESDPDAGLRLIADTIASSPDAALDPFGKFATAIAYGSKGLFQLARRNPELDGTRLSEEQLRYLLGITDAHLAYLETGLQAINEMQVLEPNALTLFGEQASLKVDAMATVLERCRPGRTHAILGWTKLFWFGPDRIWDSFRTWPPSKMLPFLNSRVTASSIIKGAVIMNGGKDAKGREYLHCMLLWKLPAGDETFGDAMIGGIYIFDDGTFGPSLPEALTARDNQDGPDTGPLLNFKRMLIQLIQRLRRMT